MRTVAEKTASKPSEPAQNGLHEALHEKIVSPADQIRQTLGARAAKL
jgi:hypothetical protein